MWDQCKCGYGKCGYEKCGYEKCGYMKCRHRKRLLKKVKTRIALEDKFVHICYLKKKVNISKRNNTKRNMQQWKTSSQ